MPVAARLLVTAALLGIGSLAMAQMDSPAGLWRTVDDKTGKDRSIVRILDKGGVFEGKVERVLNPEPDEDGFCHECKGERRDKPVVGLTILWGLKKDGDQFTGGEILDPKNGKVYRARMKLLDGGRQLEVRGFIGISLLGRSQTWQREP